MQPTKEMLAVREDKPIELRLGAPTMLDMRLGSGTQLTMGMTSPPAATTNYEKLYNRPQINGVTLSGDQTAADLGLVSENTQAGWNGIPEYVPKAGEICLYTDTGKAKIGDGKVPIVDLPFLGTDDLNAVWGALNDHTQNMSLHVSAADRERWNNKLNLFLDEETLVLNRL